MTWSPNGPRAVRREAHSESPAPLRWSLDELAPDTQAPAEVVEREVEVDEAEVPVPDAFEMQRSMEEAHARGFDEGRRAGELAEATRLRHAVEAVDEALVSLQDQAETWVTNAQEHVCALAVAVARQILGAEVAVEASWLADVVSRALAEFPVDQALIVRINPSDLGAISSTTGTNGPDALGGRKDVQWLADARIARGGCLIEGRDRIIDGRVDTALERVYRRLTYTGA